MVTTSNWIDIDGDSWDDLIVSGEWMSLRFFKNNKGKSFKEVTDEVYHSEHRGWWNEIEKGDFDNDGDMDLICLLYTSPSPRDLRLSRMPSSA